LRELVTLPSQGAVSHAPNKTPFKGSPQKIAPMNSDPLPPNNDAEKRSTEPTPLEIARCAYAIWEKEGRPEGRQVEHWLEAEAQIRQSRLHD